MIVVDTSAVIEVALDAPLAEPCRQALARSRRVLISAGTLHETLVVALRRDLGEVVAEILEETAPDVVALDTAGAKRAADVYARFGKGRHPASLNLGDCYAFSVAEEAGLPLLYIGADFAKTGVEGVLA